MTIPSSFSPLDGRIYPRFCGVRTFFRLPQLLTEEDFKNADVAILGLPFDGGTSYRPGARFAPEGVRSMSALGRGYHPVHDVSIFKQLKVGDAGDSPVTPQDIQKTHEQIRDSVASLLKYGCIPLLVGGDHSTTIGTLQAIYEKHGPVGILHFDAHTDTYPPAWGCDIHHGTFMRIAKERGWIDPKAVMQIGIRGPYSAQEDKIAPQAFGFQVVSVDDIRTRGIESIKAQISALTSGPVFISVDVDCLDPAFAPGTGTPMPAGLTSWELLQLLRATATLQIVGADVVEVSPPYDVAGITSLVAVGILHEILASLAKK